MSAPADVVVSVALCTYQGERYIREQLLSILDQTRPVDEIIVCDDGSTDGTVAIVNELASSAHAGNRIRLAATDRVGGVTANFARAMAACRGDYIALSDQDDVWHRDRVERALAALAGLEGDALAFADARLIDGRGVALGGTLHESLRLSAAERRAFDEGKALGVLIRRNVVTGAATMVTRSLVERAAPFPLEWVHDEWLAVVAAAQGSVVLIPNALIDYRLHGGNQIGVQDPSVAGRLSRLIVPRGDRLVLLGARARILQGRLEGWQADPAAVDLARRKAQFEEARAAYPRNRAARLPAVIRRWAAGGYGDLSSQGSLDVVRDLVQPA